MRKLKNGQKIGGCDVLGREEEEEENEKKKLLISPLELWVSELWTSRLPLLGPFDL